MSELKVIVGGFGVCVEGGVSTEVGAGDVILTEKGVTHSILNTGKHPLVYVAIRS